MRAFYARHQTWLEARIDAYVRCQSPTAEPARCDQMAALLGEDLAHLGLAHALHRVGEGPAMVVGQQDLQAVPSVVMMYHHDTVWPVDGFPDMRREGNRWYAPGIFDMKAGIPLGMAAIHYICTRFPERGRHIRLLSSPDEEIMGPASRQLTPRFAAGARTALVFEPPLPNGAFKQRRKGVGRILIDFEGLATHAGNHYAEGKSALAAAARLLLALERQTDLAAGKTVSVGLLNGGSAVNTRPGQATMAVDVRVMEEAQWHAVNAFLDQWRDEQGVIVRITPKPLIPPMNAVHDGWTLLADVCAALHVPYAVGAAGGASDGNNLAKLGLQVLDGLGVAGAGEHAAHEHILVDSLWPSFARTSLLLAALLEREADGA